MTEARKPLFILPTRCSCGKILCLFVEFEKAICEANKKTFQENNIENQFVTIDTFSKKEKTIESKLLNDMGIYRPCCRNIMLTSSRNKTIIKYD